MANYIATRRSTNVDRGQTFRDPPRRPTPSLSNRTRIQNQIPTRTVARSVPTVAAFLFRNTPYGRVIWFLRPLLEQWTLQGMEWLLKRDTGGWQLVAECPTGASLPGVQFEGFGYKHPIWASMIGSCQLSAQASPAGEQNEHWTHDAKFTSTNYLANPGGTPPLYRWATWKYWERDVNNIPEPLEVWVRAPSQRPRHEPVRLPQVIPMDKPILQPSPAPVPIPWPLIPDRNPDPLPEGSDRGYDLPNPTPAPVYPPINYGPPIQTRPDSPVYIHVNPPRRPPEDREKEKKFGGASDATQEFFKRVSKFKEFSTELQDILEAIHKAIDPKILKKLKAERGKGYRPTPQSLAKDIYDNFDNIDWEKALDEVVQNWAEDKVMGTAIRAGDLASKRLGLKSTLQGRGWMPRW